MFPKPQAILFDVDGTLIDSVDLHAAAWSEALEKFHKKIPARWIRRFIGMGGEKMLHHFLTVEEYADLEKPLTEYRGKLYRKNYMHHIRAFPRAAELLQRLNQMGIKTALASSAKEAELEYYRSVIGEKRSVQGHTSADDAQSAKPDPDIFEAAQQKIGNPPKPATWVVGDSPYDGIAACHAGLPSMGVLCGGFAPGELWRSGMRAIFNSPADFLERLPSLFKR